MRTDSPKLSWVHWEMAKMTARHYAGAAWLHDVLGWLSACKCHLSATTASLTFAAEGISYNEQGHPCVWTYTSS